MKSTLWTRDFTIITVGTVISILGSSMSGFAIGILVLDFTGSTFLYALFMVMYNLPKTVMPMIAGPYLDTFSRKKVIYTLDFISSGLFLGTFFLLRAGLFNYGVLLVAAMLFGAIDSVYQVAYDSLYPNLIPDGQYSKAYSVSSMIYPLATVMVPVAAYLYEIVGIAPIFLINAVTFFIAACFETQIKAEEPHTGDIKAKYNFKSYSSDFKDGVKYIMSEKGLLAITLFYSLLFLSDGCYSTLFLPYFRETEGLSPLLYTFVMACNIFGRLLGGGILYKIMLPPQKKVAIVTVIFILMAMLWGGVLFLPVWGMMLLLFLNGLLSVTTYNIRVSSTQSYVPDSNRARFNGVFSMTTTLGMIIGQLASGAVAEALPIRGVVLIFAAFNLISVFAIIVRNREEIKPVFNREV